MAVDIIPIVVKEMMIAVGKTLIEVSTSLC